MYTITQHARIQNVFPRGVPTLTTFLVNVEREDPTTTISGPSYDVASGSEIKPCNKIDKPLVVYRFLETL